MSALATTSSVALSSKLLQSSFKLQVRAKSCASPSFVPSSFLATKKYQQFHSVGQQSSPSVSRNLRRSRSASAIRAGTSGVDDLSDSMKSFFSSFGKSDAPQEVAPEAQAPDSDTPASGHSFAQFGAGCFWGVELAFQRVPGVTKTWVGYTQGATHNPNYRDVCSGTTGHSEVVRVEYNPQECTYGNLLDVFWSRHDPTTLNRQGGDVGTQYRSGIYYYNDKQEQEAKESLEKQQKKLNRKIVTEILPAKRFYQAEEYHQQYLAKGGRFSTPQSPAKGCNDPIRCYG